MASSSSSDSLNINLVAAPEDGSMQAKKRNRAVLSCLTCHQRRVKCNRQRPCEACINYGRPDECSFASRPAKRPKKRRERGKGRRESGEGGDEDDEGEGEGEGDEDEVAGSPSPEEGKFDELARQSRPSLSGSSESEHGTTEQNLPLSSMRMVPFRSFSAFVDRFQQHTQSEESEKVGSQWQQAYPNETASSIHAARSDLPIPERAKLLILFFIEQMDWLYGTGDYDDMDKWLVPFLEKYHQSSLSMNDMVKGDATRLCLLMTMMTSSIQIAPEGLIKTYFFDSNPCGFSPLTLSRSTVKARYESHIRNLLDAATFHDGASADLVRSSLNYMHFLKNEGRHGESGCRPLMVSISQLVEQDQLHLDPGSNYTELQKESRRRLFWCFYTFDRMSAAHLGFEIRISDDQITTKEPKREENSPLLGRRDHLTTIYRIKVARIAGHLAAMLQGNSMSAEAVEAIEEEFQKVSRSLPPELHPSLPPLAPRLQQLRVFDLQRHLFQVIFDSIRGALHRLCFFPSESIPVDRVQKSRKICVESAVRMIKVQESLRLRLVGDHHLRCFHVPYFLLESSITLVLASLIELGNVPSGKELPNNVKEYMKQSHRARELLISIPNDFLPASQGARLLSRVLAKAEQIIDLHAHHKLTPVDSSSAIREVLCDDEGRRVEIPFLESKNDRFHQQPPSIAQLSSKKTNLSTTPNDTPHTVSSTSTGPSDASTSFTTPTDPTRISNGTERTLNNSSNNSNGNNSNAYNFPFSSFSTSSTPYFSSNQLNGTGGVEAMGEPTYADLGIDFFNNLAVALPNPFFSENELQTTESQQTSPQSQLQQQQQTTSHHLHHHHQQQQTQSQQQQQQQQQQQFQPQPHQQTSLNAPINVNIDLDDQMDIWLASLQNFA